MKFKILSFNIHKGFNWFNISYTYPRLFHACATLDLDFIFLQEVCGEVYSHKIKNNPTLFANQLEHFADTLWTHYSYGKNAVSDTGHHGNAILSKYPFVRSFNLNISTNRFEHRGLLHSVVKPEGSPSHIHLFNTHLNLLEGSRIRQMNQVCDYIISELSDGAPAIFCGDFNDWTGNVSRVVSQRLKFKDATHEVGTPDPKTFPSFFPMLSLDRVFSHGFSTASAKELRTKEWTTLSDHLPLYVGLNSP